VADNWTLSRIDRQLDPLLRAGIAHFRLVTLHPFDDGNGHLTRLPGAGRSTRYQVNSSSNAGARPV
jgi:fido (protein-threonine AMPylation protein)